MPSDPPPAVSQALRRLESRLLAVLLAFGLGRLLTAACALLLALYGLDRAFAPPRAVRTVLFLLGLAVLAYRAWKRLGLPLSHRPGARDLAAIWERTRPTLQDRLATAVELREAPPGVSPALLDEVRRQAAQAAEDLRPRDAVPAGRALRSLGGGALAAALLVSLATLAPGEARIFFDHLLGGNRSWPQATHLVLLPPRVESATGSPTWEVVGPEDYRLAVARGAVVNLRVRAEGVVPETVEAISESLRRPMHPLGGGEFVLRLPPLARERVFHFRGNDDRDGRPRLRLIPGTAPAVTEWNVHVQPPGYTGAAPEDSPLHEFRVPQGTVLRARFRVDAADARVLRRGLDGTQTPLTPDGDGSWNLEAHAEASGEVAVITVGADGFRNPRAATLRWTAVKDRKPVVSFLVPKQRWRTLPGGAFPLLLEARDDYGLAEVQLGRGPGGEPVSLPLPADRRSLRHFERLPAPARDPEAGDSRGEATPEMPSSFRVWARAADGAPPAGQETRRESPALEVLPRELFDSRQAEDMVRARERVERLLERATELAEDRAADPGLSARRMARELETLSGKLAALLAERIYASADPGSEGASQALDARYAQGPPTPETLLSTVAQARPKPLERSGLLLDLGLACGAARHGPAERILRAVAEGEDPTAPATELQTQLQEMLQVFLNWEDFQSAVNLLRGLLDRQRSLYLRTQELLDR